MQNPEKQLNDYLDKISQEVTLLDETLRSLKNIVEELSKNENEAIMKSYWYLSRSLYDLLFDNLVLNLSWLFDKNGERSLIWYLTRMKEQSDKYFKSLAERRIDYEPKFYQTKQSLEVYQEMKNRFSVNKDERKRRIKEAICGYRQLIDSLLSEIQSIEGKYLRLKDVRDKSIAHRDKQAFDDPAKFWEDAKITIEDIETLVILAINIVKKLYTVMRDTELILVPSAYVGIANLFGRLKKYREMEKEYWQQKHRLWLLDT